MNKGGPIIIIEDDPDDQEILTEVFKELNYSNEVIFFSDGLSALEFLTKGDTNPFLILSDINLPKLTGIELRMKLKVDADIHLKCIPYFLQRRQITGL
jgi:CheY-like chemotaxis protein